MIKCKICQSLTREFYDKQFDDHYYYCEICEFISKDDAKIVTVEREKEKYDEHNNTYENEGYVNMFRDFLDRAVMPFVSSGKEGLDFGSGPGPVLSQVLSREYGYDMTIYDLFYAPDTDYQNRKYDLLTCTEVVEHLKDPLSYFEHFKLLVKSGGLIGIMTLFHPKNDAVFCDWHYRRDVTHISFFTPKTMQKIAYLLDMELTYCDEKRCCSFKVK
ncbi:MAG: class I SAM-dependent methyltransferase [Clostridia bacterium]|nr:class I SAM-dependent methyltransferase [Clostridia bacterium]